MASYVPLEPPGAQCASGETRVNVPGMILAFIWTFQLSGGWGQTRDKHTNKQDNF